MERALSGGREGVRVGRPGGGGVGEEEADGSEGMGAGAGGRVRGDRLRAQGELAALVGERDQALRELRYAQRTLHLLQKSPISSSKETCATRGCSSIRPALDQGNACPRKELYADVTRALLTRASAAPRRRSSGSRWHTRMQRLRSSSRRWMMLGR